MQLELFSWHVLPDDEMKILLNEMRNSYWRVRNARSTKFGWASKRKHYRAIEKHKKTLLMAGYEKQQILDLLSCFRLKCRSPNCLCKFE